MRLFRSPFAFAVLALVALAACGSESPTSVPKADPTTTGARPAPPPQAPPRSFSYPSLPRPGVIYDRETPSFIPGTSRMVLYVDGSFSLQYLRPDWGFFEYKGQASRRDSLLTFAFSDASVTGRWIAEGVQNESLLSVKFNDLMQGSDFEDGDYRSTSALPPVPRIFVANSDGTATTRLTAGDWPSWSPDGQRVAFHRDGRVYLVGADGSGETFLVEGQFPAWAPDGRRIAFVNAAGISVMSPGSTGVTLLLRHGFRTDTYAPFDMGVAKPAWSPDGSRIAFEHAGDGDTAPAAIFVMNADGSQPRSLTNSSNRRYAESDPSWSSDGSRIIFWSYGFGIATVSAGGGAPTSIYMDFPTVAYGARPMWSPNGHTITFSTSRARPGEASVLAMPNGAAPRTLVPDAYHAAWSPNGGRIAFVTTSGR